MSYSSAEQQPQQPPSTPIGFKLMGTESRLPDDVAEKGEGAIAPTAAAGGVFGGLAPQPDR